MSFEDHFPPVCYEGLDSRQQENFIFAQCAARLALRGFACTWLSADYNGADFLAYHMPTCYTLPIQLKSRFTLAKKYIGKRLWIAFPYGDGFVVMEHDKLHAAYLEHNPRFVEQSHWQARGERHMANVPSEMLSVIELWLI